MESDTRDIGEASSEGEIVSVSTISVDLDTSQDLSFNVKKDITKVLHELVRYEKSPVEGCSFIEELWNISSSSMDNIHGVIDHVNGKIYPRCLVNMLTELKSSGYFPCRSLNSSDLWIASTNLFDCVCLFSKYSEEFCRSLIDAGIITILEDNLKLFEDKSLLKDKTSKPFFIVKATLCLVKNLAKNVTDERLAVRKCFLTHLYHLRLIEELNVFATIGAVLLCNRCEAKLETENKNTIPCLMYWVNQSYEAFNDPTSWNAMYNLQDATGAIWILANFGNASRFCENIVLHSFHQILKTASLSEIIQTVEIIWVLCFDSQFEEFIKNNKIVKTMRLLERNGRGLMLSRRLNAVLTILRERYFPRSVSVEGYEDTSETGARIVYHEKDVEAARMLGLKLRSEHVSAFLNESNDEDVKYFETVVSWMHKCYCVIICVSEFTELDYESRTILYIAQKLHKDIIAVFVKKDISLSGWIYQELMDKKCFDFIESPFYVKDLAKLLVEKSINFSRRIHGLRNTRSLGSLTSKLSILSDCSDVSVASAENVSLGDVGRQSSDQSSCPSLNQSSLPRDTTAGTSLDSQSSWSFDYCVPEKIKEMTRKDVSEWLKSLKIGIIIRDFRKVDGSILWELATAFQSSNPPDENSYDGMMEQFKLSTEQKTKFTDALLKL